MNFSRISFFILLACMLIFGASCAMAGGGVGEKASAFSLISTSGDTVTLNDVLKTGKAVLIFSASWCPYCVEEVPAVNAFYAKKKGSVSVFCVDVNESAAKAGKFIKDTGMTYPVLLDPNGDAATSYGVKGIPTVIAIDASGAILYNGHSIDEMESKVKF